MRSGNDRHSDPRSKTYLLRLKPAEHKALERMARATDTTLAEAFRSGAHEWLVRRELARKGDELREAA